jgi:hypothetical protein
MSVLGVTKVRWKRQGEIRIGDYTVFYSLAELTEKVVAIVALRSALKCR